MPILIFLILATLIIVIFFNYRNLVYLISSYVLAYILISFPPKMAKSILLKELLANKYTIKLSFTISYLALIFISYIIVGRLARRDRIANIFFGIAVFISAILFLIKLAIGKI